MSTLPSPQKNDIEVTEAVITSESPVVPAKWYFLAPLLALIGGVFGILGAAYSEYFHGSIFVAFIGAPIIEEIMKPSGVYLILAKWPLALRNRFYSGFLSTIGGIAFALIENLIYLNVYIKDPNPQVILWRYSVCIALHAGCSFIFGLGINRALLESIKGERKFFSVGKRFFIPAMVIHCLYNITIFILAFWFEWLK